MAWRVQHARETNTPYIIARWLSHDLAAVLHRIPNAPIAACLEKNINEMVNACACHPRAPTTRNPQHASSKQASNKQATSEQQALKKPLPSPYNEHRQPLRQWILLQPLLPLPLSMPAPPAANSRRIAMLALMTHTHATLHAL